MAFDYEANATRALTQSASLVPLPTVNPESHVILTPSSYSTWAQCLAARPERDLILSAGDYDSWGEPEIDNALVQGTRERPRTIRLDYPRPEYASTYASKAQARSQHPVNLAENQRAKVGQFTVDRATGWILSGLWHPSGQAPQVQNRYADVTIDMPLIENTIAAYSLRGTNGTRCKFQRGVSRNGEEHTPVADRGGPNFKASGSGVDQQVIDAWLIDWENYDTTDCFSVTNHRDGLGATVQVTVENCDFYFVLRHPDHIENFVDLKIGDPARQSIMRGCRMWGDLGLLSKTGSTYSFTIHLLTSNWLITQNIIDGNPNHCFDESWGVVQGWMISRRSAITDNFIRGATDAFGVRSDWDITGNVAFDCEYMLGTDIAIASNGYGPPNYSDNVRIGDVGVKRPGAHSGNYVYTEPTNEVQAGLLPWGYWRRQWTGPEFVTVVAPAPIVRPPTARSRLVGARTMPARRR